MRGQRFRKQRALANTLADIRECRAEPGRRGAFGQQVESLQNRQTGLDQGVELLVENQEIGWPYLAGGTRGSNLREKPEMAADVEDVQSAVRELLAGLIRRLGRLDLLENPAGGIANFADKFSHQFSKAGLLGGKNWRPLGPESIIASPETHSAPNAARGVRVIHRQFSIPRLAPD